MMATTETLRGVLRTSRGQPILKLQSAEQRVSLALDLLSLGSRAALGSRSYCRSVTGSGSTAIQASAESPGEHSSDFWATRPR